MMMLTGEVTLRIIVLRVTVPKSSMRKNTTFLSYCKEMCHLRSTLHSLTNRYQCLFCGVMHGQKEEGGGLGWAYFLQHRKVPFQTSKCLYQACLSSRVVCEPWRAEIMSDALLFQCWAHSKYSTNVYWIESSYIFLSSSATVRRLVSLGSVISLWEPI